MKANVQCRIANEFGEQGRSIAHAVSMFSIKYDEAACDAVYTNTGVKEMMYTQRQELSR